ncbi:MAG: response regulator, partial [Myxococcales bacterium]
MSARVLIVDDNTALADNLRDILEGAVELDVSVTMASDGQTALDRVREGGFDVALVDVRLPDGSGVDLVRSLRAVSPFGEVILVTGFATVDSALAALQTGVFAFLLKSFRPEELLSTVEQALAKVHLKRDREALEHRQRALIDTAGVLIVAVDPDDRVALFNPKVAELTATGVPAAVGRPFVQSWITDDSRERVEAALSKARTGLSNVEVESGFADRPGHGQTRRVHWFLSSVPGRQGAPDLVYGIGVDVTERRALERRAAEAEALSAMGTLALGLAHEIRNPLNAAAPAPGTRSGAARAARSRTPRSRPGASSACAPRPRAGRWRARAGAAAARPRSAGCGSRAPARAPACPSPTGPPPRPPGARARAA